MKNLFIIFLFFVLPITMTAQTIYLSSLDNKLYRLNMSNCQTELLTTIQVQGSIFDISFHPNRNLYGITSSGDLIEIDTLSGTTTTVHSFGIRQAYSALTIADDGRVYTCGSGKDLLSYEFSSGIETYHGQIPYPASGDLTFFNGDLYVAVSGNRILKVDIDNPENSTIEIEGKDDFRVFGIVTYIDDCRIIKTYAISDDDSEIYEIDFEQRSLNLVCQLNIQAGGGASTFEYLGASANINLQAIDTISPNCNAVDGSILIVAASDTGNISFSIDGVNFQSTGLFENLAVGNYQITINNDLSCPIYRNISLNDGSVTFLSNVRTGDTKCGEKIGFIEVNARNENGSLQYSLDQINYQEDKIFRNLEYGEYEIYIKDTDGCLLNTTANILQGDCDIYIPNAFSPNNDGINDLFKIYPQASFLGSAITFKIFDRWGNLVFEKFNFDILNTGWDGTFRDKEMAANVYVYFVEIQMENGDTKLLKGDVTLLR